MARLVSEFVLELQAEAVVQTLASNILRALEVHCGPGTPADILSEIRNMTDHKQLWYWFEAGLHAGSHEEFRVAMLQPARSTLPHGGPPTDDRNALLEWRLQRWESTAGLQTLEWQAYALRYALMRLLEKRCQAPVPEVLAGIIETTHDLRRLYHWLDAAADVNTFDAFYTATQLTGGVGAGVTLTAMDLGERPSSL